MGFASSTAQGGAVDLDFSEGPHLLDGEEFDPVDHFHELLRKEINELTRSDSKYRQLHGQHAVSVKQAYEAEPGALVLSGVKIDRFILAAECIVEVSPLVHYLNYSVEKRGWVTVLRPESQLDSSELEVQVVTGMNKGTKL